MFLVFGKSLYKLNAFKFKNLNTGPVFKWHSNNGSFGDQTSFDHLNTRLARYSDPLCTELVRYSGHYCILFMLSACKNKAFNFKIKPNPW